MGVSAELMVSGRTLALADPSGGTFNAAGDFDRLLPVSRRTFPEEARAGLYGNATVASGDRPALVLEVAVLLEQAKLGPERRGLLRLQAMAIAGQGAPDAVIRFSGD